MRRHHKDWLAAYLQYTQNSEAPDIFHQWTGLGTLAGALRRKCYINQGNFAWHSNMFLFFIAPPGVISKSTTIDIGMKLLRQVDGIHWGPSIMTWQALVSAFVAAKEEYFDEQGATSFMCSMTVAASELGTFFDPANREQVDLLVSLWDSRDTPIEKLTKATGLESVEKPWLNLLGCTTPSWIGQNLSSYFSGGGFSSRTLYIYGETKRRFIAYPREHILSDQSELERTLVEDLQSIATLSGNFTLTPNAIALGTSWYEELYTNDHPFKHDDRFMHYLARKQAHVHKAAMLRSASLRNDLTIHKSDLQWAINAVTALEPNMVKAFGELDREEIVNLQIKLLGIIRHSKKLKKRDLYQKVMFSVGHDTFDQALNALLQSGLVVMINHASGVFVEFVGEEVVAKVLAEETAPAPVPAPEPILSQEALSILVATHPEV
jgi:hypothetical protein